MGDSIHVCCVWAVAFCIQFRRLWNGFHQFSWTESQIEPVRTSHLLNPRIYFRITYSVSWTPISAPKMTTSFKRAIISSYRALELTYRFSLDTCDPVIVFILLVDCGLLIVTLLTLL